MERRFAVHARARRQAVISLALVLASGAASAAPKDTDARALFDRGVGAYTRKDYSASADALQKSYALEVDPDTLFAWAQAERKLGNCLKAIELYDELLAFELPRANRDAIAESRAECKQLVETVKPAPPAKRDDVKPRGDRDPGDGPKHTRSATTARRDDGGDPAIEVRATAPRRPWYREPVGDTLVGVGVVGMGVGIGLLVSASAANSDKKTAATYTQYKELQDRATSRGRFGVIAGAAGAGFAAAGLIWYATRGGGERATVTGWLAPATGGLVVTGAF